MQVCRNAGPIVTRLRSTWQTQSRFEFRILGFATSAAERPALWALQSLGAVGVEVVVDVSVSGGEHLKVLYL